MASNCLLPPRTHRCMLGYFMYCKRRAHVTRPHNFPSARTNMLAKLSQVRKLSPFAPRCSDNPKRPPSQQLEIASSALKIVHAGGQVECYYMAIPACRILDKYPSHALAKPDVFTRPWDSVVRPDKILTPGQKFLLIPHPTVKKLRKQIRKPSKESSSASSNSFFSQSDASCFTKKAGVQKRVRFVGIDVKHKAGSPTLEKKGNKVEGGSSGGKRRPLISVPWQPSLRMISESQIELSESSSSSFN